jgi:hypothetical protein
LFKRSPRRTRNKDDGNHRRDESQDREDETLWSSASAGVGKARRGGGRRTKVDVEKGAWQHTKVTKKPIATTKTAVLRNCDRCSGLPFTL